MRAVPLPPWMIAQGAHPLPPLSTARLHVLGISGRGLAPLAAAAAALGADVTGCDPGGHAHSVDLLSAHGIPIAPEHAAAHLASGRRLVATAGAPRDAPEVAAAAAAGRLHRRMDLTAAVMAARPGLGVVGSHGKGTVAALAAAAVREAGMDPLTVLGVHAPNLGGAFVDGRGPAVMEVDESDLAAHFVVPEVVTVTNLDDDHPHLGVTLAETAASVAGLVGNARRVVILGPSPRRESLARHASVPVWRIGVDVSARVVRPHADGCVVAIRGTEGERVETVIRLIGGATATNVALAYASARALGADPAAAARGLSAIDRLDRRLEPLGRRQGVAVYDDFGGKHPANVRAGVLALRRRHPGARIIAIFEPVFAAMVRRWGWRYARALQLADVAIVLPTYEHPDYPSTADLALHDWHRGAAILSARTRHDAAALAARHARPGDVIVGFMQMGGHGRDLGAAVIDALGAPA